MSSPGESRVRDCKPRTEVQEADLWQEISMALCRKPQLSCPNIKSFKFYPGMPGLKAEPGASGCGCCGFTDKLQGLGWQIRTAPKQGRGKSEISKSSILFHFVDCLHAERPTVNPAKVESGWPAPGAKKTGGSLAAPTRTIETIRLGHGMSQRHRLQMAPCGMP